MAGVCGGGGIAAGEAAESGRVGLSWAESGPPPPLLHLMNMHQRIAVQRQREPPASVHRVKFIALVNVLSE